MAEIGKPKRIVFPKRERWGIEETTPQEIPAEQPIPIELPERVPQEA